MNADLQLSLCIIKVVCLIVIAFSLTKFVNMLESSGPRSYMNGAYTSGANMRFNTTHQGGLGTSGFIGSGANEAPVNWNVGDLNLISSNQSNNMRDSLALINQILSRLNSNSYVGTEAERARARAADFQLAEENGIGLVQQNGVWKVAGNSGFRGGKQSNFGNRNFMNNGKLSEHELGLASVGL
jgi:hypothetical protein